jgi:uncharacterized protein YecT (DUF1311 family)
MALAIALSSAIPPRASAQSFDCAQARAPSELLICSDSALAELDQTLATTYQSLRQQQGSAARDRLLREQRNWLDERDQRCNIPATGSTPTLAQRWVWSPCLAERYRERLTQLGAAPQPVRPPGAAAQGDYVHPLCLDLALGGRASEGSEEPVPVMRDACNRGNRHIPVTSERGDGWLAATGMNSGVRTYFGYRPVGRLADGRTLSWIEWSGGGTGQFSEVAEVRQTTSSSGDTLINARTLIGGGDRCSGGIDDVRLSGGVLEIVSRVTPGGLAAAGDPASQTYDYGLMDCAICCAGTLTERVDVASGRRTLVSASVTEVLSQQADEPESAQACFDNLLAPSGTRLPRTLAPAELAQLSTRFAQTCRTSPAR